jgi:hypothetical protein
VEIHYALWAVLAVPLGFAGVFFAVPGLQFAMGLSLLAVAGALLFYISYLTRLSRAAWWAGVVGHALLLAAAVHYVPRWPILLGVPLALANLYSLAVLLVRRELWSEGKAITGEAVVR